ncbi:kinase-like protein [Trematosphaeria pertusa]|uniref:Kinase-like protein n=1 Tax=Trematosphaeria pertusa TaxID=390896 RepID=A0A6A6I3Y2_9PLEO|nr:kinase-like protein [Trematosphaeria pertusa]KAF2245225.1 kinase-like protein [Trematosphaeria pertusa]
MESDGILRYPPGFRWANILASGISGLILLDEASQTVVKYSLDWAKDNIDVERRIYERFKEHGGHKNIVRYLGPYDIGIRLEYIRIFDFKGYIRTNKVDYEQKIQWAEQIISALCFVHARGVVHGNLNLFNILLDENLNAKVADFAGSSLDRSPLLVVVTESYRRPGDTCCIKADIFAFGSTVYNIVTGQSPYHDLSDCEIDRRFERGEFPETDSLGPLGKIISKCWRDEYPDATSIHKEIKGM